MPSIAKVAQGSERPSLALTWTHADNTTGENLTGATLTGWIKDLSTNTVRAIAGDLVITNAATGAFRWDLAPADVATDGSYEVQFSATWPDEPTPGRTAVLTWEIAPSLVAPDDPAEAPDYQGVVKLLARTTDPDEPATGFWGLYVKAGGLYLMDADGVTVGPFGDPGTAAANAVAAHVALADPHAQYLTEEAAATAYSGTGHTHAGYAETGHTHDYAASGHDHDADYAASSHSHDYAATAHNHDAAYISVIGAPTAGNIPTITSGGELANSAYSPASFATADHDHDADYAAGDHTHTGFATDTHNHDASYSASGHNHDASYSATGHNHDSAYAAASHAHTAANVSDFAEAVDDRVAALLVQGANVTLTYDDNAGTLTVASSGGAGYTDEQAQDAAAGMLTGGSHAGITATYQDSTNTLDLAVTVTQYTDEMATDAAAAMLTGATHSGASVAYDDGAGTLAITVASQGGIPATLLDAKGDLIVASAADTAARLAVGASNGMVLTVASGEATGVKWAAPVRYLTLGRSGTLTATAGTARLYVPFACTITNVRASVGTAPTGASAIVDVLLNGTTLWGTNPSNRPTITATNYSDLTNTPDTTSIAADDYLTLTVSQVGSIVAGADLVVTLEVTS